MPIMTKSANQPENIALLALCRLVGDHGDQFKFSLSKRGRLWLTFTHWTGDKYNTSVELDPMGDTEDMLHALTVLCTAHYAKCFRGGPHLDTWLGIGASRDTYSDSHDQLRVYILGNEVNPETPTPA